MLILNVRSLKEVSAAINQLSVNLITDLKGTRGKNPRSWWDSRDVSGLISVVSSDTFHDSTQGLRHTT